MKRCPICDKVWPSDMLFCPRDGHKLKLLDNAGAQSEIKVAEITPSFDLISEIIVNAEQIEQNLATEVSPTQNGNNRELIRIALDAIEHQRNQERDQLCDQLKLFDRFNICCRATQQFIEKLTRQSDRVSWKYELDDEWQRLSIIFTLTVGEKRFSRNFPIIVSYHRFPRREVTLTIDLNEIGADKDSRHLRTEKAGGKVEYSNMTGYNYLLKAPANHQSKELNEWLESSFKTVFQLAYGVIS